MAKLAKIKVAGEFLNQAMGFPENTKIIRIRNSDENENTFEMIVEHPDFNNLETGALIPQIIPVYRQIQFNWNLPLKKAINNGE